MCVMRGITHGINAVLPQKRVAGRNAFFLRLCLHFRLCLARSHDFDLKPSRSHQSACGIQCTRPSQPWQSQCSVRGTLRAKISPGFSGGSIVSVPSGLIHFTLKEQRR